jgi:hypothetical protein
MQPPQFLLDLLQLLLDLAVPAAFCTLAAAGVSLRHEGGVNFHVNGRTGKWVLWTIVLLTLPQLLSWIAAQGINIPSGSGSVSILARLVPWAADRARRCCVTVAGTAQFAVFCLIRPSYSALFVSPPNCTAAPKSHMASRPCPRESINPSFFK